MRFKVTAEDIKYGKRYEPKYCPIALALRRVTGRQYRVSNYTFQTNSDKPKKLSGKAIAFITLFDDGNEVKPIFLDLPTKRQANA